MKDHDKIRKWVNDNVTRNIECYSINPDSSIDVTGSVVLAYKTRMKKLPVKFNRVGGLFTVRESSLTTFEGFPIEAVAIYAQGNPFKTLKGMSDTIRTYVDNQVMMKYIKSQNRTWMIMNINHLNFGPYIKEYLTSK